MRLFDFFKKKKTSEHPEVTMSLSSNDKQSMSKHETSTNSVKEVDFSPFIFKSNCHQRYENDVEKGELQKCLRTVSVEKNTNGCKGYKLEPGVGYIVKVYNDDLGKSNMSDKPMKIIRRTSNSVELRGFPIEAMSPFGWQEVDYNDYGFVVYYDKNGNVDKCVLHMYDRDTRIEYCCKTDIKVEDRYTKMIKSSSFNPFKITCEPALQNKSTLPDLRTVFEKELQDLYAKVASHPEMITRDFVAGYPFILVESYYNNGGYVPKNSLDEILEQVYDAIQKTGFRKVFNNLDEFKYHCYYGYLNN